MSRPASTSAVLPRALAAIILAAALTLPAGCARPGDPRPVQIDRDALGTVVTITAYGRDESAVRSRIESAFAEIEAVESVLDAHDESSTVAALNRAWAKEPSLVQTLPSEAGQVIAAAQALGVTHDGGTPVAGRGDYFSSALLGVSRLYDFEGEKSVPPTDVARTAASWEFGLDALGGSAWFGAPSPGLWFGSVTATMLAHPPGLDFGGSAKGLALDRAAKVLRESGVVDAALVTAGSTTVTFGEKPESEPWCIGIEDPREPGAVVAVVEASSTVTVSTSGDYQQHFERDGINWHHVLDPVTGRPAWGLRSLTVIGAPDGLTSDILSTALFVMGPVRAVDYAREKKLGLYMIDTVGEVTTVGPVPGARWRLVEEAEPRE